MSKTAYMRGLQNFIQDIRAAQNKEQEQRRVEKELAKISAKFSDDRSLSGYDRRKYVWKLLYIHMLGYPIQFGFKQAADLIPQLKYKDKQVGYMACSLLLRENDEFLRLTMNAIRQDLTTRNEAFETLALSFIGSVGGSEMADSLTQDVIKLLSSSTARPLVKKRAALALLRLIRKLPTNNPVVMPDTFAPVINALLDERDLGLLLATATLLHGLCVRNAPAGYEGAQPRLIKVLERLTMQREREVAPEYLYYGIPSPWLQCKCLRVLQFFPPPETAAERTTLNSILHGIIESVGTGDAVRHANPNKANALYGILFEAIALALQFNTDQQLLTTSVGVLGSFLTSKEPNVKYLALETLARLAQVPSVLEAIRHQQATVQASLKDPDSSIRKRGMDLLYAMCDASCVEELVKELLAYLVASDPAAREEVVLKVAILAEKFAPNGQWYVDVSLELLHKAGEFVGEEVWHRVVQLVASNPAMQPYAVRNTAATLKRGSGSESLVSTAAHLLGDFGGLITAEMPPPDQAKLLTDQFAAASQPVKGLLLTALIKIYLRDPQNAQLRTEVVNLYERNQKFMSADQQQRAAEFLTVVSTNPAAAPTLVLNMPRAEAKEPTTLTQRLAQVQAAAGAREPTYLTTTTEAEPPPDDTAAAASAAAAPAGLVAGGPASAEVPPSASAPAGAMAPAAPPPKPPANAIDLLSDLLGDAIIAAPPAPTLAPTVGPTGAAPAPGSFPAAPLAAGVAFGAAGVASTNPFAQPGPAPLYPGELAGAPPPYASYTGVPTGAAAGPPYAGYTGGPAAPGPYVSYTGALPPLPGAQPPAAAPYAGYTGAPPLPAPAPLQAFALQPQPLVGAVAVPAPLQGAVSFGGVPPAVVGAAAAVGALGSVPSGRPADAAAVRPLGSVEAWFNNLLVKERGILYEDPYLQVGLQARYTRGTGQVMLFLGNKSQEAALTALALQATPPPGLQVVVSPLPAALAPGQQVQVAVQVAALAPFSGAPQLLLAYQLAPVLVSGAPAPAARQELRLPVTMHKFCVPEPGITKELFFEQWKAHSQLPNKAQEMVDRGALQLPALASPSVVAVMRLANLGVEHGYLDPSPSNEAGAAEFVYGPPGGPEQSVLVMARVEGNPQNMTQFRVTVSSAAPQLSVHVKELLVAHLKTSA